MQHFNLINFSLVFLLSFFFFWEHNPVKETQLTSNHIFNMELPSLNGEIFLSWNWRLKTSVKIGKKSTTLDSHYIFISFQNTKIEQFHLEMKHLIYFIALFFLFLFPINSLRQIGKWKQNALSKIITFYCNFWTISFLTHQNPMLFFHIANCQSPENTANNTTDNQVIQYTTEVKRYLGRLCHNTIQFHYHEIARPTSLNPHTNWTILCVYISIQKKTPMMTFVTWPPAVSIRLQFPTEFKPLYKQLEIIN